MPLTVHTDPPLAQHQLCKRLRLQRCYEKIPRQKTVQCEFTAGAIGSSFDRRARFRVGRCSVLPMVLVELLRPA